MPDDAARESDDAWAARVTRAARLGSGDALAEMYDRCAENVVGCVRRTTRRDESFALDCLQEMFMKLAANPPIVDAHAALLAWMRVSALNVARSLIVAETRRKRRERAAARDDSSNGAGSTAADLERLDAQIDEDERILLRLRHVEGLQVKAIARALGATPRAVESALRRLTARLRDGGAA